LEHQFQSKCGNLKYAYLGFFANFKKLPFVYFVADLYRVPSASYCIAGNTSVGYSLCEGINLLF